MLRGPIGTTSSTILSCKGVMQGCIWRMIFYGIGLLRLDKDHCCKDPFILYPWYANHFALEGPALKVTRLFQPLCRWGPDIGYFPSPVKT